MTHRLSRETRRHAILGVVGLVFVTAGCLGTPGTEVDNPGAVSDRVESRYEHLEGFQATMTQTVTVGDRSSETHATVAFDKDDYLSIAYHSGPKAGEVDVVDNPSPSRIFAGERAASSQTDTSAFYGTVAADLVREKEIVYEGTDRINGRLAAVVSITPPRDEATNDTGPGRRVWIDAENVVPLRIKSNWTQDGHEVTETVRFENISLGVPESSDNRGIGEVRPRSIDQRSVTGGGVTP